MRVLFRVLSGVLVLATIPASSQLLAQVSTQPPDISQSLNNLTDQPASHTGFVFDRSMLQAARGILQSGGMSPERAAAVLSSVSYDNYRYAYPAIYAPAAMDSIVAAYHSAGWKHLVNAHDFSAETSQRRGPATDLWLHFTGSDIDGITVLLRSDRDVNMIQVAGDLRPLDLIRLSGHFGIPKVDPNAVMVPAPENR